MKSVVFQHEIFEPDEEFSIQRPFELDAPEGCRIDVSYDAKDGVWIQANRAGFDHLARVFAELAVRKFEGSWHSHFDKNWRCIGPDMISIEIAENFNGEMR